MLFDPEDGKTMKQILDKILRKMKPTVKAEPEEISEYSGRSVHQLMLEGITRTIDTLKDPAVLAAWLDAVCATRDRRKAPLGFDPLVRKGR